MSDRKPDQINEDRTDYIERKDRQTPRRPDPLRGLLPGLILIVLGVLFFATTQGWISWAIWWQYLLIGLGVVFLIDAGAHYLVPEHRQTGYGRLIPGVVLLFVGLAFVYGFDQWWPLILIAVGVIILLNILFRRR